MKKIIFPIILVILLIGIYPAFNNYSKNDDMNAVKGVLNLDNYNFKKDGKINIGGEWELYVNKLLTPQQLKNKKPDKYLTVPCKLENQLDGKNTGYMTIHLKILLPKGHVYGLRIGSFLSASKIWVNGTLQDEVGKVGKSYNEEKSIYIPSYIYFTTQKGICDIVIQSSNYRIIYPVVVPIEIGFKGRIMNKFIMNAGGDLIIVGGLFIVELFLLCLYNQQKSNKSLLYFFILCILVQLRCLFLNENIAERLFPNMPFELLSKTAALTYYLYVPIYILFLKEVFPDFPKKLITMSMIFSATFTIICIITNNTFYDRLAFLSQFILFLIMIGVFIFFIKKLKEGKKSSISFIAFIAMVSTTVNDILVNNGMIYSRYGFQVGMFIFAFLEVYVITMNYSDEMVNAEKLKIENRIIYEKSIKDDLTNLYKRNYIENLLDDVIRKYIDKGEIFSILMFDIDYFKNINDSYGHLYGDEVLTSISNIIIKCVGSRGNAGRYGGEEFIAVLPDTKKDEAVVIAEKIRKDICEHQWDNDIKVTVSGGVYENKSHTCIECMKNVDDLLYKAKRRGRNKIISM